MVTPVVLAGGIGSRLWPVSRQSFPKQFCNFDGDQSLFQQTIDRFSHSDFNAPLIMTNSDFRFIIAEQMEQLGIAPDKIVIEPHAQDTAAAILAAALMKADTPNEILMVCPSDHKIENQIKFDQAVKAGKSAAQDGKIVTFGIVPDRPETGYGYLELKGVEPLENGGRYPLKSFVEKPDLDAVKRFLKSNHHLWNAGIFMFKVETILNAFSEHASDLMLPCRVAVKNAVQDLCFTRLEETSWSKLRKVSFDYAILEKIDQIETIALDAGWSDLGSWQSIQKNSKQDVQGNSLTGTSTAISCSNTQLRSEDPSVQLVGLGLDGITAIATRDAVLVTRTDDSENVKEALKVLSDNQVPQAVEFMQSHRPWGYFESLALGTRFQVKQIVVKPNASLSLQSHVHRAEHWVVVQGTARVSIDNTTKLVSENESVFIPLGAVHRLENPGKLPLHLIEVQTGAYLGEDDIIRYEDNYARASEAAA